MRKRIQKKRIILLVLIVFIVAVGAFFLVRIKNENTQVDNQKEVEASEYRMQSIDEVYGAFNNKDYDKTTALALQVLQSSDYSANEKLGISMVCMQASVELKRDDTKEQCHTYALDIVKNIPLETTKTSAEKQIENIYQSKGYIEEDNNGNF